MARLGIDREFLWEFGKLQPSVQDKVADVFAKFANATHAGVHLEKISGVRDPRLRSIRIDQFWRGIVIAPESDDSYTLLRVLPHDDAYAWARRRRASVNQATGAIELRDVVAIEDELPHLLTAGSTSAAPLLAGIGDADLARLGIDDEVLPFARGLTDIGQLEQARGALPEPQYDVLVGLAIGMTPEQVWAEVAAAVPSTEYDPDDLTAAIARSSRRVVLVEGPAELMEVFAYPFAQWRIFLHPSQHQAAYGSYRGPARLTGGPGTGKTVAALHRAQHLARAAVGDRSVLLTTFTRTLTSALESSLRVLIDDDAVLRRIDVRGLDQLAHHIVSRAHGHTQMLAEDDERTWWTELVAEHDLVVTPAFLSQEWRGVVLTQGIATLADYQAAARSGRGRRLSRRQKEPLWAALSAFADRLTQSGLWTYETVCVEATRLLTEAPEKPYRHIVVDEAQDLAPWQWRLLRAAVAPGPDDLFIAGDAHQRIYGHRVSLRKLGIDVAGRSERLRISYRTTAEILAWSMRVLHDEGFAGIDGDIESLAGYRSEIHGEPPAVIGTSGRSDELDVLINNVRGWLDAGVAPDQIGVAARTSSMVDAAVNALVTAGIPVVSLRGRDADGEQVSVATMHRMKGLEFRCVAVIGVSRHLIPHPASITPDEDDHATHTVDLQRERCLLFVACTRARELLAVSWHGEPSPFLPESS